MAKVEIRSADVQKSLMANIGRVISITGVLKSGDPINRLNGDALEKDIEFQRATQHRRFLVRDPHYKFTIESASVVSVDGKKTAAEAYLEQQIYGDDGLFTVETKSERQDFALGYRKPDGIPKLINRRSILGKKFSHGQKVTLNYKIYEVKDTGEACIGFENMVFEEIPSFWEGASSDAIGAFPDWDIVADDLLGAQEIPNGFEALAEEEESELWDNQWE